MGGRLRNRTAEAQNQVNTDRRIPKTIQNDGGRKTVPSFAGNINIGPLDSQDSRLKNPIEKKIPDNSSSSSRTRGSRDRDRIHCLLSSFLRTHSSSHSSHHNLISLFDQIKARAQGQGQGQRSRTQNQQFQAQVAVQRPRQKTPGAGGPQNTFGVFESVNLGENSIQQQGQQQKQQEQRQQKQQQQSGGGFFGAFQSVDLQG